MENVKKDKKVSTKSKKGNTLNKIKKVFVKIVNKIVNKIKELWKKFMALPKKVRYVVYVWAVIFLLIIVLIVGTNNNNIFLKDYHNLEEAMNAGALDYVKTYSLYPVKDNKLKIDLELLKEDNFVYDDDIKDKTCTGFTLVHYDDKDEKYVINSYINCSKYTTKGYSDYK